MTVAFVVAATWQAKPGEQDRVEAFIRTLVPLSRAEGKNLAYEAHRHTDDPHTFFLYEKYVDESGYVEHKESAHFQQHAVNGALPLLETRGVATYQTLD